MNEVMNTCICCKQRGSTTAKLCLLCQGIMKQQRLFLPRPADSMRSLLGPSMMLDIDLSAWDVMMDVLREYRHQWRQDMEALNVQLAEAKKKADRNRMDGELALGVCHRLDSKSAKEFVKWLGLSATTTMVHVSGVEGGSMYSRTVPLSDALTAFLAHVEEQG